MSTVKDIESAVTQLSRNDLAAVSSWFAEFDSKMWDRQIEADAGSGRLDAFYQSLRHENEGQADIPLDEVLDKEMLP
jgi:hypothetical protein